jgi:hypothetical protein
MRGLNQCMSSFANPTSVIVFDMAPGESHINRHKTFDNPPPKGTHFGNHSDLPQCLRFVICFAHIHYCIIHKIIVGSISHLMGHAGST